MTQVATPRLARLRCELDHVVVVAGTRVAGIAWVESILGVPLQPGGEHERMGTHNALLRLGERRYLEVISVNPTAPTPGRTRWFGLDVLAEGSASRLATFVARTDDIRSADLLDPGAEIEPMSRGALSWLIQIRRDGSMPGDGILPTLIQWPAGTHPAAGLEDRGCKLASLECFHPEPDRLRGILASLGLETELTIRPIPMGEHPYLVAHIETPNGERTLGGPATRRTPT